MTHDSWLSTHGFWLVTFDIWLIHLTFLIWWSYDKWCVTYDCIMICDKLFSFGTIPFLDVSHRTGDHVGHSSHISCSWIFQEQWRRGTGSSLQDQQGLACVNQTYSYIKLFSFGNKPVLDSHVGMLTKHLFLPSVLFFLSRLILCMMKKSGTVRDFLSFLQFCYCM